MDPIFVSSGRQPAPPSVPPVSSVFWQAAGVHPNLQDMDYQQYGVAPPTHNITSPPTTPMTPGPHHVGGGGFPPMCTVDPHVTSGLPFQSSIPSLSHSAWPPEFRLFALCQEIQRYSAQPGASENKAAWEQFCVEYFHEMAVFIIETDFGDGFKRYSLHGNLILWYFKSIVESGATRFDVILGKIASHSYQQHIQRIECPNAVQELDYELPHQTKVCSKGQLVLEFTMEEKPRIISWLFRIQSHVEMIPRFCLQTSAIDTALSNNLTCQGLPASTQAVLMQLNSLSIRQVPPKLIQVESNAWEHQAAPPPLVTHQHQQEMMSDNSSSMLSHLPPGNQESLIPPVTLSVPLTHSVASSPQHPPLSQSPILVKSTDSSYGSTCSVISNSNATVGVVSKLQTGKKIASPVTRRSDLVMIASEPALFSDDMVHGFDERRITRVDNHSKRVVVPTPPSLSTATPGSTISEPEMTTPTNSLTNQNGSLVWLNTPTTEWSRLPHSTEQ